MSRHQEWKMIHLLYQYARRTGTGSRRILTEHELTAAGVHCDPDSRQVLEDAGVVRRVGDAYELSRAARKIVSTFTVARGPEVNVDVRVAYPEVFVVMPFGQPWSNEVFGSFFKPAIEAANFIASRGDAIVRVGDLGTNIWKSITQAGVSVQQGLGRQSAARRILLSRSGLCPADDADHRLRPWAELAGGACRGEACAGITMALCHPVRRRMLRPPLYGRLARRRRAMGSPGRSIRRRGCVAGCGMRLGGCFAPTGVTGDQRLNAYAGLIVAEVTVPNPNVYYELGLAAALGKPVFAFKQAGAVLPADISGVHFYDYTLADLAAARNALTTALTDWANMKDHAFFGVKALADR